MPNNFKSIEEYLESLPKDRKEIIKEIRDTIKKNIPKGFEETINYGMLGYVVPHNIYADGYHANPDLPLPFINLASQKNFIALYHMAIYADKDLLDWFTKEYGKVCKTKLDMGKSCIRFKKIDEIPIPLIGQLVKKISVKEWIRIYESQIKR